MNHQPTPLSWFQAFPKIELHRHLEGSIRLATLVEIAAEYHMSQAYQLETLRPLVQIQPDEPRTSAQFLQKFQILRQFYRSPQIIQRITRETIQDAAQDHVIYMELRFTPAALSNILRCSYADIISWVTQATQQASAEFGIQVRLIASLNRHESPTNGLELLEAALAFQQQGIVAIDLAGDEYHYNGQAFYSLFERAKSEGLAVTVHAGEWAGAESVREALDFLHADRIGHGIRAIEDANLLNRLVERQTVLEICPTSNYDSGVVANQQQHPLKELFQHGVNTTINTDDPSISNITLSEELYRAAHDIGFSLADIQRQQQNALYASFLPTEHKTALMAQFNANLQSRNNVM